jgi:hypothetical protein
MQDKLSITRVHNGYVLCYDDNEIMQYHVVTEPETEFGEAEGMYELLKLVQELFGYFPSKHNRVNCRVELEIKK